MSFPRSVDIVDIDRRIEEIRVCMDLLDLICPYVDIGTRIGSLREVFIGNFRLYRRLERISDHYRGAAGVLRLVNDGRYSLEYIDCGKFNTSEECIHCNRLFVRGYHICDMFHATMVIVSNDRRVMFSGVKIRCMRGDAKWSVTCYEHNMYSHVNDVYYQYDPLHPNDFDDAGRINQFLYEEGCDYFNGVVSLTEECMAERCHKEKRKLKMYVMQHCFFDEPKEDKGIKLCFNKRIRLSYFIEV